MGDVWIPDTAVSSHIVRASMDVLEDSWDKPNKDLNHKLGVATAACIIISEYFGYLLFGIFQVI